jgi:tetratricopeptide (TPR) repeat protein
LLALAMTACSIIYIIGGHPETEISRRIAGANISDFSARIGAWRGTAAMIIDFPLFGVGSGAWPEIFPHYQAPPQSLYYFFRTCENDYLQLIAEHGIAGLAILVALAALAIKPIAKRCRQMPPRRWPLAAALVGGLISGLVQEFTDSSLHIPANVLLFTILLGLAVRTALTDSESRDAWSPKMAEPANANGRMPVALSFIFASGALALIVAAWQQDERLYPYGVEQTRDPMAIETNLTAHPSMAASHLVFALILPKSAHKVLRRQFAAAAWLEPNNAAARDLYARSLLLAGERKEALQQIALSVFHSPFLDLHYYLAPSAIAWLLPDEQRAVMRGFDLAILNNFVDAAGQLATFYEQLGRYLDAAAAYSRAARLTADSTRRVNLLLRAGYDYVQARKYKSAERVLLEACAVQPQDLRAYVELTQNIYGPIDNLTAARDAISEGIRRGADPYVLQMALATAAENAGNHAIAEAALIRALQYDSSFPALLGLGRVYFAEQRFDRAATTLQKAIDLKPDSAEAYMWLGRALEANYNYYAAEHAYQRAVALAPADMALRNHYRDFQQRVGQRLPDGSYSAAGAAP